MIRQDQLLGSGTVDDVRDPIVEIRRAAPCDRDAAEAQASPTFHFRERFPTAFHCCVDLLLELRSPVVTLRRSGETEGRLLDEGRSWLANLTSVKISVSRLRLSARNARAWALGVLRAAWNRRIFGVVLSVDEGIVIFRGSGCESASNGAIWSAVDNCGNVDKV